MSLLTLLERSRRKSGKRVRDRRTPRLEVLENRALLSVGPDLRLIDAFISDSAGHIEDPPAVGSQAYVAVDFQATGVPAGTSYVIRQAIDGVAIDDTTQFGAGSDGIKGHVWGTWVVTPGVHTVTVTLDATNAISGRTQGDNSSTFTFTAITFPGKFITPLGGSPYLDWSIVNYVDLDTKFGSVKDWHGGDYTYDTPTYNHSGIDFTLANFASMDKGVPVYAAADGVVIAAHDGEFDRNTGFNNQPANYVMIDHGGGWQTWYEHLRKNSEMVHVGDHVYAGDVLGLVGSSGNSTDAHLHFEVEYRPHENDATRAATNPVETYVDPSDYWANPLPYSGDQAGLLSDVFVTDHAPTDAELKEGLPDKTVFASTAGPQLLYSEATVHGLKSTDLLDPIWYRPDGTSVNFGNITGSELRYNREQTAIYTRGPQDNGRWTVIWYLNGRGVTGEGFNVTPTPAQQGGVFDFARFTNYPTTYAYYQVNNNAGLMTIEVTRTGSVGAATVSYATLDGDPSATALAGRDYISTSGTLAFADGERIKSFQIPIINTGAQNTQFPTPRRFFVHLTGATGNTVVDPLTYGTTVDILGPDTRTPPPTLPNPTASINDVTVVEPTSGTVNAVFTVTLSAADNVPVTVDWKNTPVTSGWTQTEGTATAGVNFQGRRGVVTFAPGQTSKTVTIKVFGVIPSTVPSEFFVVNLVSPDHATLGRSQGIGTVKNFSPTLDPISDQTIAAGQSATLTLHGTDPNGLPLTYSAQAQTLPYWLKQTFNLYADQGGYYTGARGQGEKYLRGKNSANGYSNGGGDFWYYILPNGDLYEFTPPYANPVLTGALVAHLGTAVYSDPTLLWNASSATPVMLTVAGNQLTITPNSTYTGTLFVTTSVTNGQASASQTFKVVVTTSQGVTLDPINDQTMATGTSLNITLVGHGPNGLPLTYSAQAQTLPYLLKQAYSLYQDAGGYYTGARGQGEKYLRGKTSANNYSNGGGDFWYYLLTNGDLYEFTPAYSNPALKGALVAHLGTAVYNDPSLLWNTSSATPVTLTVAGNQLTIAPNPTFTGTLVVTASVTNGQASASQSFKVIVTSSTSQAPTLAPINDQTGSSPNLTLVGTDPNGLSLTYSAQAQTLTYALQQAYSLYQDPGGYYIGARGQGEKYLRGRKSASGYSDPGGYWYYIMPNGDLYEFEPAYTNPTLVGAFVAHLSTAVYNDPSLLWNAANAPVPVTLTVTGNQLTIAPNSTYTGTFVVTATVTNGQKSASQSFNVTVTAANQAATSTTIASATPNSVFGQLVAFTAHVTPASPGAGTPTGIVAFKSMSPDGSTVVTLGTAPVDANGTAVFSTYQLVPGSRTIFAVYLGDNNFATGTSATIAQAVKAADTQFTITAANTVQVAGQANSFSLTVTVIPPGTGVVAPTGTETLYDTFNGVTTALITVSVDGTGTIPPFTAVGTHVLTATYSGDSNYHGSTSAPITVTVIAG